MPLTQPDPTWLHWLASCPSTNTWALDRLAHLQHGDVVFTTEQTAGRGQHGRTWYAPPGVLTASIVLDRIPAMQLTGLSLVAGLAVVYAIEDLLPDLQNKLQLKWTNDVWLNGRKLAGILCEGVTSGSGAETKVVVGIGLNCRANFAGLEAEAMGKARLHIGNPISLHQEAATVPDDRLMLERLRRYLLETAGMLQRSDGFTALLPTLRQRDALLGKSIAVTQSGVSIAGEAVGIDDRGCLRVKLADGTVQTIASGQVRLQVQSRVQSQG